MGARMSQEDDAMWKKRFQLFALMRIVGLAIFLLGIAIASTGLIRPGGWPALGAIIAIVGAVDAIVMPRLLKRSWDKK